MSWRARPWMMIWAPISEEGLSSTGLKSVCGGRRAAIACSAWARPISPPSAVTALFKAMFCGLNGATRTPCLASTRHRPATSVVLPASEVVPCTIRVSLRIGAFSLRRNSSCAATIIPRRTALPFLPLHGLARAG